MAKVRIVWEVDNGDLEKSIKELKELSRQAGLTEEEVNKIGDSFGEVQKETKKTKSAMGELGKVVAGLGLAALAAEAAREFFNMSKEIAKARRETALLTNETGAALDKIVTKLRATSQTFNKDYNEVLRAANTLSKQFGITTEEAINQINAGFARGLDVNGEYLDSLKEYSTFVREAGIDTEQFNAILQKQVTEGVFSDKGIDAIKEAVISLREMTPATQDALRAIGLSAEEVTTQIQSGALTYFDVIQEISRRTREETNPRAIGQVYADVFRGAGEDAGDFILKLDEIGETFQAQSPEASALTEQMEKQVRAAENLEMAWAGVATAIGEAVNKIKAPIFQAIADFINFTFRDQVTVAVEQLMTNVRNVGEMSAGEIVESISEAKGQLNALNAEYVRLAANDESLDRINRRIINQKKYIEELEQALNAKTETQEKDLKVIQDTNDEMDELIAKYQAFLEVTGQLDEKLQGKGIGGILSGEIGGPTRPLEPLNISLDEAQEKTDDLINVFQLAGNLANDVFSGIGGSVQDMGLVVLNTIRQIIQALFAKAIAGAVAGATVAGPFGLIAAGAAVSALTALWQSKVPKFHEGKIDINDKGEEFPAILKSHESVMKPEATIKYKPILEKMQKLELDPNVFLGGKDMSSVIINSKDIERAFENGFKHAPRTNINIDSKGFWIYQQNTKGSHDFQRKRLFG